jgi:hypothetical protein
MTLIDPFGWQNSLFMGWSMGKGKEGLFWGPGILLKTGRKPTLLPAPLLRRRLSSCEGVPTPKISLIRENAALLFWDIPDSKPVWLSGAILQLKITANSTYWEANLRSDGLGVEEAGKKGKKGGLGLCRFLEFMSKWRPARP